MWATIAFGILSIVEYRITRSLTQRVIGIGDLYIDTAAGGNNEELIMHQIAYAELEKVALRLNELLSRDQEKADEVEPMKL